MEPRSRYAKAVVVVERGVGVVVDRGVPAGELKHSPPSPSAVVSDLPSGGSDFVIARVAVRVTAGAGDQRRREREHESRDCAARGPTVLERDPIEKRVESLDQRREVGWGGGTARSFRRLVRHPRTSRLV